ncbi:MAG: hypothetical protein EBR09_06135 [Proteobacteria bacterium]|nr:hypothetical protein [Pseudomonadota bacterium]
MHSGKFEYFSDALVIDSPPAEGLSASFGPVHPANSASRMPRKKRRQANLLLKKRIRSTEKWLNRLGKYLDSD